VKKFLELAKRQNRFVIPALCQLFSSPGGEAAEFVSRT
jgi:hypothetical protein